MRSLVNIIVPGEIPCLYESATDFGTPICEDPMLAFLQGSGDIIVGAKVPFYWTPPWFTGILGK